MITQAAHLYATLCLATVFFQIALILGAPLGAYTQGGRVTGVLDRTGRIAAAASIPVLMFQALAILSAAGFPGLGLPHWTGWLALAVSALSAVLNLITPSAPERRVWVPVTLIMTGAAALVVLLGP